MCYMHNGIVNLTHRRRGWKSSKLTTPVSNMFGPCVIVMMFNDFVSLDEFPITLLYVCTKTHNHFGHPHATNNHTPVGLNETWYRYLPPA